MQKQHIIVQKDRYGFTTVGFYGHIFYLTNYWSPPGRKPQQTQISLTPHEFAVMLAEGTELIKQYVTTSQPPR